MTMKGRVFWYAENKRYLSKKCFTELTVIPSDFFSFSDDDDGDHDDDFHDDIYDHGNGSLCCWVWFW